jgi:hypothetical protein
MRIEAFMMGIACPLRSRVGRIALFRRVENLVTIGGPRMLFRGSLLLGARERRE